MSDPIKKFHETLVSLRGVFESICNDFNRSSNNNNKNKIDLKDLSFPNVVSEKQLHESATLISKSATQFHILFSNPEDRDPSTLEQLKDFEQNIIYLISLFSSLISNKQQELSRLVRLELELRVRYVLESCTTLVQSVANAASSSSKKSTNKTQTTNNNNNNKNLEVATGVVWETCKEIEKFSLNPFQSTRRYFSEKVINLVEDAIVELEDAQLDSESKNENVDKSNKSSTSKQNDDEEDEDDEDQEFADDFDDMFSSELDSNLLKFIQPVLHLNKLTSTIMKKVRDHIALLETRNTNAKTTKELEWIDNLSLKADSLTEQVDEMTSSLYETNNSQPSSERKKAIVKASSQISLLLKEIVESLLKSIELFPKSFEANEVEQLTKLIQLLKLKIQPIDPSTL